MKRWTSPLLAAGVLAAALPLAGQAGPGSLQFGVDDGRVYGGSLAAGTTPLFTSRVQVDDNIIKGFTLGAQLTANWALDASLRYASTDLVQPGPGVFGYQPKAAGLDYRVLDAALERTWRLGRFHPYGRLGAGLTDLHVTPLSGPVWSALDRPTATLGAGARFWMCPRFAFRFDARFCGSYLGARGAGQDQGAFDGGRWLRTQQLTAGLQFTLRSGQ
jgi:hypothetical protein